MEIAVIKTGGKQYIVSPKQKIKIEKLDIEPGQEVVFDQVLLLEKNKQVEIGQPLVEGATVSGKVLAQTKGDKVIALRYKAKKRVHTKTGHRQQYTEVEIKSLITDNK